MPYKEINLFYIGARGKQFNWGKNVNLIGFDADQKEVLRLKEKHPKNQYFCETLGRFNETRNLYITKSLACTSLLKPIPENWRFAGREKNAEVLKVEEVKTKTLATWCEENKIYPDFIRIDVQGAELEVLDGCPNLDSLAGIETEVFFYPLYEDAPLFYDVYAFLHAKGFELYRLNQCLWKGRLIFGDALFLNQHNKHFDFLANKYKVLDGEAVQWLTKE